MTPRRLMLGLGWLAIFVLAALGVFQAWVDEAEPPMGACLVFVVVGVCAIGLDAMGRATRPPDA